MQPAFDACLDLDCWYYNHELSLARRCFVNTLAILLALAVALPGCAAQSSETTDEAAAAITSNPGEPRAITDLDQISTAPATVAPAARLHSSEAVAVKTQPNVTVQQNIERLFVSNLGQLRYREGRADAPGDTALLNDKARKFSEFSYQLLNQTLAAARTIEPDRLTGRALPNDISPMVLTAVLDAAGRLTEISIESHSGDHQVDQIIIDSCKKGLWSRNPPGQAIDTDGVYRVRIRGYIRAYTFNLKGEYKYETEFGLAML